jgi:hypothetical protein
MEDDLNSFYKWKTTLRENWKKIGQLSWLALIKIKFQPMLNKHVQLAGLYINVRPQKEVTLMQGWLFVWARCIITLFPTTPLTSIVKERKGNNLFSEKYYRKKRNKKISVSYSTFSPQPSPNCKLPSSAPASSQA